MRRWIMHVDMDAFYASVEQRDNPDYKGHPVIVGGLSARGVVATASYEARKYGVHSAMATERARKLCPNGIFLWPRIDYYKEISAQIHKVMEEFTDIIEPLSLDEAFLDVTGSTHRFKGPYDLGRTIKRRVFEETGLIISAGLAPNKFLAKIASDLDKPDGLVVVPYGKEMEFLRDLPVQRLWGVGAKTEKRFLEAGFKKIGDIQLLPDEKKLIPIVGNQAKRFWDLARGIDHRPVEPHRQVQSIGREETYETDLTDESLIDREFQFFANRVAFQLRKQGLMGTTVSIKIRYDDFSTITRQKTLDTPTDSESAMLAAARSLYAKVKRPKPVRLLGLTMAGLSEPVAQTSLFDTDQQEEKLADTLDELQAQFGRTSIMKGLVWERAKEGIGRNRDKWHHGAGGLGGEAHQDSPALGDPGDSSERTSEGPVSSGLARPQGDEKSQ